MKLKKKMERTRRGEKRLVGRERTDRSNEEDISDREGRTKLKKGKWKERNIGREGKKIGKQIVKKRQK